jgi:hypothetical protein
MIFDQSQFGTLMVRRRNYNQPSLTRKYLDLVEDYLELQRLRVAVKRAEFQELKRKESRHRREADQDAVDGSASQADG